MNRRYQEKIYPIHLKSRGIYQPKNVDITQRFCRLMTLMENNDMENEAQALNNLRHARSNYLWAISQKSRGGNHRIGAYTTSLRKAKTVAQKLYHALLTDTHYPLLCKPTAILDYLRSECSCIT